MVQAVQMQKVKATRLSVLSNTVLIVLKLVVGISMGSVSVISEAVHSGVDLVAALIAWYSVRTSSAPADKKHNYGHGKIENVAGTIEALLIFGAAVFIIVEAVHKIAGGSGEVEGLGVGAAVMGVSALANYLVSRHLLRVAVETDSVALEADALHLRTDVYTSVGVLVGLIAIKLTGIAFLDPLVAIVVALLIIKAAWDLTGTAFSDILDAKLPDEEESVIHAVLEKYRDRFVEYHNLRTRKSGHMRHIDMHLVVRRTLTIESGHELCDSISADLRAELKHCQVLVHLDPYREPAVNTGE